jgi:hypothetical protein
MPPWEVAAGQATSVAVPGLFDVHPFVMRELFNAAPNARVVFVVGVAALLALLQQQLRSRMKALSQTRSLNATCGFAI